MGQIDEYYKRFFRGLCPYTNKPCEVWDCVPCKVNKEEVEDMERDIEGVNK